MNQAPALIIGWPQCLHSSLRSTCRSRVESDIALLLAGRERECVSQPSVPGTVIPMMPNTLLPNVALRDRHWNGVASLRLRLTQGRRRLGIKTAPIGFARSLKGRQWPPTVTRRCGSRGCSAAVTEFPSARAGSRQPLVHARQVRTGALTDVWATTGGIAVTFAINCK
jgi:hypothetical protein